MVDGEHTVTLKRPFTIRRWAGWEKGHEDVVLPTGTTVRIGQMGALLDYPSVVSYDRIGLELAVANVRCPHVFVDSDGDEYVSHPYLDCNRFDGGNGCHTNFCRGDATRCPSSKVRAEAKESE